LEIESIKKSIPEVDCIVLGGLNTDLSRSASERPSFLREFCDRIGLHLCTSSSIDFTYENAASGAQSTIDHFIISDNLKHNVVGYSVSHDGDNLSDHEAICLTFDIQVDRTVISAAVSQQTPRLAWHRATGQHKQAYQECLRSLLAEVEVPYEVLRCKQFECSCFHHLKSVDQYHDDIMNAMLTAARTCIPKNKWKQVAGWTEFVKESQDESIFWNKIWISCGKPHTGWASEIRRMTRGQYKILSEWVLRNQDKLSSKRLAEALSDNRSRYLWNEVKRVRKESKVGPQCVDDAEGPEDVTNLFKGKYESLYNSVSFDQHEMDAFLHGLTVDISQKCQQGRCDHYFSVDVSDVKEAVGRLNGNKSDAIEELSSNNFIFACHDLFVHLSLLFNMFFQTGAAKGMLCSV
jgi:hypothetical protein